MLEPEPKFGPVRRLSGYLPLEDLGLIGDGATTPQVGRNGCVPWLCVPGFDAGPLFCGLLDRSKGGHFSVTPERLLEARQRYETDTGVLTTELRTATGLMRITDALVLRSKADLTDDAPADRGELVRSVFVLAGDARIDVIVEPRGGAQAHPAFNGLEVRTFSRPDLSLHLRANRPLTGLHNVHELAEGDRLDLVLSWGRFHCHHRFDADAMPRETAEAWRRWMTNFRYDGPQEAMVRRAAITLKLCDHWVNGSLAAAPTSSLPAPVGGVRNWDLAEDLYASLRARASPLGAVRADQPVDGRAHRQLPTGVQAHRRNRQWRHTGPS
jgi:alpha,alpha-trehalase